MIKYVGYLLLALAIAFGIEFFGFYDVPFIDLPRAFQDDSYYTEGRDRQKEAVKEIEENAR